MGLDESRVVAADLASQTDGQPACRSARALSWPCFLRAAGSGWGAGQARRRGPVGGMDMGARLSQQPQFLGLAARGLPFGHQALGLRGLRGDLALGLGGGRDEVQVVGSRRCDEHTTQGSVTTAGASSPCSRAAASPSRLAQPPSATGQPACRKTRLTFGRRHARRRGGSADTARAGGESCP